MGYADFYIFLMPLYCLSLGMSAGEVGMIVGARSALAVFLSIHVGVLMDRFGTRRVTLFFVWTGICLAPVFPLVPWFWPLLLLQIVNGGALSFAWSGSQTLIAQLAEGDAGYIGRFSFFARIGTAIAPLAGGLAWDFGGAWTAYLLGAVWGVALTVALLRAPEAPVAQRDDQAEARRPRFRLRDALPRLSDYLACFALMAIPAVAATIAIMLLRNATNSVQYLALYRLSRPYRACRHGDRHPVRRDRDRERLRLARRRPRDALGRPAEDDAERHRGRRSCSSAPRRSSAASSCCCCWRRSGAAGCRGWSSR